MFFVSLNIFRLMNNVFLAHGVHVHVLIIMMPFDSCDDVLNIVTYEILIRLHGACLCEVGN